jgi:hypothetical protein
MAKLTGEPALALMVMLPSMLLVVTELFTVVVTMAPVVALNDITLLWAVESSASVYVMVTGPTTGEVPVVVSFMFTEIRNTPLTAGVNRGVVALAEDWAVRSTGATGGTGIPEGNCVVETDPIRSEKALARDTVVASPLQIVCAIIVPHI